MFHLKLYFVFKTTKTDIQHFSLYLAYSWDVEFPEDRHLIKSQSRRKSYSYDRSHTEKTYDEAARICQEKGK